MTLRDFLARTDRLITDGDALVTDPDWDRFRAWLLASDELLEQAWGRMDRYHLAWLNVGRDSAPPGSPMNESDTARFMVELASAKLAVLRTMRITEAERGSSRFSHNPDEPREEDP